MHLPQCRVLWRSRVGVGTGSFGTGSCPEPWNSQPTCTQGLLGQHAEGSLPAAPASLCEPCRAGSAWPEPCSPWKSLGSFPGMDINCNGRAAASGTTDREAWLARTSTLLRQLEKKAHSPSDLGLSASAPPSVGDVPFSCNCAWH